MTKQNEISIKPQRKINAWVEYLKRFKADHPDMPHKEAVQGARKSYQPINKEDRKEKIKKEKKEKKEKKVKLGNGCDICDYTSNDKSNFNRHMLGHRNRAITELVKARGLLRTHEIRAVRSKNIDDV